MKALIVALALLGGVIGIAIPGRYLIPGLIDRVQWKLSGGEGERALWDEPAFLLVITGGSYGLGGAATGAALGIALTEALKRRAARRARP